MEEIESTVPANTETRISRCTGWQVLPVEYHRNIKLINLSFDVKDIRRIKMKFKTAIKERNLWVHQTHTDSIDIPNELTGGIK